MGVALRVRPRNDQKAALQWARLVLRVAQLAPEPPALEATWGALTPALRHAATCPEARDVVRDALEAWLIHAPQIQRATDLVRLLHDGKVPSEVRVRVRLVREQCIPTGIEGAKDAHDATVHATLLGVLDRTIPRSRLTVDRALLADYALSGYLGVQDRKLAQRPAHAGVVALVRSCDRIVQCGRALLNEQTRLGELRASYPAFRRLVLAHVEGAPFARLQATLDLLHGAA